MKPVRRDIAISAPAPAGRWRLLLLQRSGRFSFNFFQRIRGLPLDCCLPIYLIPLSSSSIGECDLVGVHRAAGPILSHVSSSEITSANRLAEFGDILSLRYTSGKPMFSFVAEPFDDVGCIHGFQ